MGRAGLSTHQTLAAGPRDRRRLTLRLVDAFQLQGPRTFVDEMGERWRVAGGGGQGARAGRARGAGVGSRGFQLARAGRNPRDEGVCMGG